MSIKIHLIFVLLLSMDFCQIFIWTIRS